MYNPSSLLVSVSILVPASNEIERLPGRMQTASLQRRFGHRLRSAGLEIVAADEAGAGVCN